MGDSKLLGQAPQQSGLFSEARLMQGATDYLGQDLKANLLRLFAQPSPLPPTGAQALACSPATSVNSGPGAAGLVRNALGNLGQSANKTQALNFPLPSKVSNCSTRTMELSHCCASCRRGDLPPRPISCRAWRRPAPCRMAPNWRPGRWRCLCAISTGGTRQVKFQEEQRKTGEEARESSGASNWPST